MGFGRDRERNRRDRRLLQRLDLTVFGTKALFEAGAIGSRRRALDNGWNRRGNDRNRGPGAHWNRRRGHLGYGSPAISRSWATKFCSLPAIPASQAMRFGSLTEPLRERRRSAGPRERGISGAAGIWGRGYCPSQFRVDRNEGSLHADDPSGQQTLWVTDGTAAGTFEIGGVNNAGVAGAPAAGLDAASSITASGGMAYFSSPDSTGT